MDSINYSAFFFVVFWLPLFIVVIHLFLFRKDLKKEIIERIETIKRMLWLPTWVQRLKYGPNDHYFYEKIYIDKKRNRIILPVLLKKDGRPIFEHGVPVSFSEIVEKNHPYITITGRYDYIFSKREVIGIFLVIKRPKLF